MKGAVGISLSLVLALVILSCCTAFGKNANSMQASKASWKQQVVGKMNSFEFSLQAKEQDTPGGKKTMLTNYSKLLVAYPYPTKIISSGIVGGLGDILVQILMCLRSKNPITIDFRRLTVFTTVAALYIAPVIHLWFNWLEKFKVPSIFGNGKMAKSLVMIFLDQTIGAVVISAGFYYAFEIAQMFVPPIASLSLSAAMQAGNRMNQRHLWRTLVVNWYSWPIINFLNFHYIPIQYRLLVSNIAAVFWNMFLSNIANS